MWWLIGSIVALILSVVWIAFVTADGFRRDVSFISPKMIPPYVFHGGFGVLGLWLMLRVAGS